MDGKRDGMSYFGLGLKATSYQLYFYYILYFSNYCPVYFIAGGTGDRLKFKKRGRQISLPPRFLSS